jgi:4-hydroxymandelate oxidase
VLVGRPVLWGLATGGAAGVEQVLSTLAGELRLAMALCGAPTVTDLTPDLIARAWSPSPARGPAAGPGGAR